VVEPLAAGKVLKVEARSEGKYRVVRLGGQLTEAECGEFVEIMKRELSSGASRVILDLDNLLYISSAGLGALVSVHQAFMDARSRLILAGTNPKVRKLLTLTSLDKLIQSTDSVGEALALP
jgi:anti-sigma B factor antagonist